MEGMEAEEAWRRKQTQRPIESENWKLNIEENVVGLPQWKGKEAWFFLVPKGRFSDGQEGDSWWDENIVSRNNWNYFEKMAFGFGIKSRFWLFGPGGKQFLGEIGTKNSE